MLYGAFDAPPGQVRARRLGPVASGIDEATDNYVAAEGSHRGRSAQGTTTAIHCFSRRMRASSTKTLRS